MAEVWLELGWPHVLIISIQQTGGVNFRKGQHTVKAGIRRALTKTLAQSSLNNSTTVLVSEICFASFCRLIVAF